MEPFGVVKIKFKMQFFNLDDLGLGTLTYSNTSYAFFNLPIGSFWLISVNFRIHFGRLGQPGSRYIGPFFYILINLGRFSNFEQFKLIGFRQFWFTSIHFGWFVLISLDFGPSCLILINWVVVT